MNKKGFALVELLAVIVVLGIILAVAIPNAVNIIEKIRVDAYKQNEKMMISAAQKYLVNSNIVLNNSGDIAVIRLTDLQQQGLLDNIADLRNNQSNCNGYLIVKKNNVSEYSYLPYLKCGSNYISEGYVQHQLTSVDLLVVAGGGSGGTGTNHNPGGGGGSGGLRYIENYQILQNNINVIVGNGGINSSGQNSSFDTIVATGGGKGGNSGSNGSNGGSGGGAGGWFTSATLNGGLGNNPNFSPSQGNNGGNGLFTAARSSGGGGGAGSVGMIGNTVGGSGGVGVYFGDKFSDSYGQDGWFAGGGGGSIHGFFNGPGVGGIGGGGAGGSMNQNGNSAIPTTGGGGGGASGIFGLMGGNGGSGIIILRYLGEPKAIGGAIKSFNGYTIHIFASVGQSTFELIPF